MNNIVELWLFRTSQVVRSQYTGEVGKFETQISWGYHVPKIIVIFRTIVKKLQIYCKGILIWLYYERIKN